MGQASHGGGSTHAATAGPVMPPSPAAGPLASPANASVGVRHDPELVVLPEQVEAEKLLEALARPCAEGVRDLEELSTRHDVEADVEGVEEYLAMMTEA
jgi:hypothetical protein